MGVTNKMAAKQIVTKGGRVFANTWRYNLAKWQWDLSGYGKLGLYEDDTMRDSPVLKEALKRLDPDMFDERQFRMSRAQQLGLQKAILPKEDQTTFDQDVPYLKPLIEEIEKENAEKHWWNRR